MNKILPFFRYTLLNLLQFLKALFLYPFSKLARHRLSNAYSMLTYPFFGNRFVDLSYLLKSEELAVCIAPLKAREHNVTAFELLSICAIIKDNDCNTIFEIGTFDGRTTRAMAMSLNNETVKVYTLNLPADVSGTALSSNEIDVDLAAKVISGERFINTAQHKQIEQLWGDSASFDFSPYYQKTDLVFIDGAHSRHYVKNDTQHAMQMIKKEGGFILWHDAHLYGVVEYLSPWIRQNNLPVYFIKGTSLAIAGIKNGQIVDLKKETSFAR